MQERRGRCRPRALALLLMFPAAQFRFFHFPGTFLDTSLSSAFWGTAKQEPLPPLGHQKRDALLALTKHSTSVAFPARQSRKPYHFSTENSFLFFLLLLRGILSFACSVESLPSLRQTGPLSARQVRLTSLLFCYLHSGREREGIVGTYTSGPLRLSTSPRNGVFQIFLYHLKTRPPPREEQRRGRLAQSDKSSVSPFRAQCQTTA